MVEEYEQQLNNSQSKLTDFNSLHVNINMSNSSSRITKSGVSYDDDDVSNKRDTHIKHSSNNEVERYLWHVLYSYNLFSSAPHVAFFLLCEQEYVLYSSSRYVNDAATDKHNVNHTLLNCICEYYYWNKCPRETTEIDRTIPSRRYQRYAPDSSEVVCSGSSSSNSSRRSSGCCETTSRYDRTPCSHSGACMAQDKDYDMMMQSNLSTKMIPLFFTLLLQYNQQHCCRYVDNLEEILPINVSFANEETIVKWLCIAVRDDEVNREEVQQLMRYLMQCTYHRLNSTTISHINSNKNKEDERNYNIDALEFDKCTLNLCIREKYKEQFNKHICSILEWATALHVLDVIECLQYECNFDGIVSNMCYTNIIYGIERQWHPLLHPETIKICLRHLISAVVVRRACSVRACGNITPDPSLHGFHACILCAFPSESTLTRSVYHDIAVLSIMALKHASCTELCNWFAYARQFTFFTPVLSNKFLACCAMNVNELGQRGLEVSARDRAIINNAFHELCASPCKAHEIEEGLVHGCAILNSLRCFHEVRALYTSHLHKLRETAHSVLACVALHDAHAACNALDALAQSKQNGWRVLNPMTWQVMMAVCRLVGSRGSVSQVHDVYRALVHFHNHVLKLSNLVETILGGLCDRVERLATMYINHTHTNAVNIITSPSKNALESMVHQKRPTKEVVTEINSILEAILMYIGDDFNADTVFKFIECIMRVPHIAVQLTTSVVWILSRSSSLAIRDLFRDVSAFNHKIAFRDTSSPSSSSSPPPPSEEFSAVNSCKVTHQKSESFRKQDQTHVSAWVGLPLIKYYAVCIAREMGNSITLDHLCSVWQIHAHETLQMPWRPSYQLWQCAECGRANSDRFNYCVCSALQSTYAMCNRCGHAHDERVECCPHCGLDLRNRSAIYSFTIRQAWVCQACNKSNPARLMWQCVYCHAWTGPLAKARHAFDEARKTSNHVQRSVTCRCTVNANIIYNNSYRSDTNKINNNVDNVDAMKNACMYYLGYCPSCGQFEWTYSYFHSFVWQCSSCHKLRCSLERYCPECPEVVCAPALYRHECTTRRYCSACNAVVTNPFTLTCPFCHGRHCSTENLELNRVINTELCNTHFGSSNNITTWQSYSTLRYEPCSGEEQKKSQKTNNNDAVVSIEETVEVVTSSSPLLKKECSNSQELEHDEEEGATHAVKLHREHKENENSEEESLTILHTNPNAKHSTCASCELSYICESCFAIYNTTNCIHADSNPSEKNELQQSTLHTSSIKRNSDISLTNSNNDTISNTEHNDINDCVTCETKKWHLLSNVTRTCSYCQHVIAPSHFSLICPFCHCHVPIQISQEQKTNNIKETEKINILKEINKKDVSQQNDAINKEITCQESNAAFSWNVLASCVCTCNDISTLLSENREEEEREHYSGIDKLDSEYAQKTHKGVDIISTIQTMEDLIANESNLCCNVEEAYAPALSIMLINTMQSIEERYYDKQKNCTLHVRRALALTKQLLSNWYTTLTSINHAVEHYSFFHSYEKCHACLGSHTFELCSFYTVPWMCEMCGVMNVNNNYTSNTMSVLNVNSPCEYKINKINNTNTHSPDYNANFSNKSYSISNNSNNILASRYVCVNCLSLRPCVQLLMPAECWLCTLCHRANIEFEMYCIYCGAMHETDNIDTELESEKTKSYTICNNDNKYTQTIPFAPMKCAQCHTLYMEASCPSCDEYDEDIIISSRHNHHHHENNNKCSEYVESSERIINNTEEVNCTASHSSWQASPIACKLPSSTGVVISRNNIDKTTYTPRSKNNSCSDKENHEINVVTSAAGHAAHSILKAKM